MRHFTLAAVVLAALAIPAFADDVPESAAAGSSAAQPAMTPQEQAAMEAYMKAATPGEQHAALEPMVGDFDATVTSWMKPGAPPDVSKGSSSSQWIFGGRYLEQKFNGSMMGTPFEGRGFTGFDNVRGKYTGIWMDSMSTGTATSVGSATGKGEFEFIGTWWDPMTGKETSSRQVLKIRSANEHVFEMYGPGPEGKEAKMMEIVYKRK